MHKIKKSNFYIKFVNNTPFLSKITLKLLREKYWSFTFFFHLIRNIFIKIWLMYLALWKKLDMKFLRMKKKICKKTYTHVFIYIPWLWRTVDTYVYIFHSFIMLINLMMLRMCSQMEYNFFFSTLKESM
jgi:hypothetical protein